jgi:Zn-dependent protease with chaperone function
MPVNRSAWLKNACKLAACLFIVPLLGWLTGMYLENSYERQFQEMLGKEHLTSPLGYSGLCAKLEDDGTFATNPSAVKLCEPARDVRGVFHASVGIAILGGVLLLLIVGARTLAGQSRQRMSLVFGPLIRVVLMLLAISVLAQGALFVYSIYTLEAATIHQVHTGILGGVAIGALVVCAQLLRAAFAFFKAEPSFIRGALLDRTKHAKLYALVEEVARKLGARVPENIVAGLEPNFYVTANQVRAAIPDHQAVLSGSTLYVSLSLMRVLAQQELRAVLGHELGHFRGEDTAYSLRFAPTYARLSHTLNTMLSGHAGNASDLARLPALQALGFCWMQFASAERSVGRERELLADQARAEAQSPRALAAALVKVALYSPIWAEVMKQNISELAEGRMYNDLSHAYSLVCNSMHQAKGQFSEYQREVIAENVQPHPVDTHPPLSARLSALGMSLGDIKSEELGMAEVPAIGMIEDADVQANALTVLEDQWLVAVGAVVVPKQATPPIGESPGATVAA